MRVYLSNYSFVAIYEDDNLQRIFRYIDEWATFDNDSTVEITIDNTDLILTICYENTQYAMRISKGDAGYCVALHATPRAAAVLINKARKLAEIFR